MRNTRPYIIAFFIITLLYGGTMTYAAAKKSILTLGFGGRIMQIEDPNIICFAQYGPITITPYNSAPAMPYFIRSTSRSEPKIGGHILGLYKVVPDLNTCVTPELVPVPAFEITTYGTSSR